MKRWCSKISILEEEEEEEEDDDDDEKQWLQEGIKVCHKHKKTKMKIINFPLRPTKIIRESK